MIWPQHQRMVPVLLHAFIYLRSLGVLHSFLISETTILPNFMDVLRLKYYSFKYYFGYVKEQAKRSRVM